MMPVACRHEQGIAVFQDYFIALCQLKRRIFVHLQLVAIFVKIFFKIYKAQYLPGLPVYLMLFFEREQKNPFTSDKLRMYDMRQVDVKMHMRHGTFTPYK